MRSLSLLQLLGALAIGANGFAPRSLTAKPRLLRLGASNSNSGSNSDSAGGSKSDSFSVGSRYRRSPPPRQTPRLADVMGSWFNLPSHPKPALSGAASGSSNKARTKEQKRRPTRDDIRADIVQLRVSNAELREEVVALRTSMIQRGYTPVDDIFATPKTSSATGTTPGSSPQHQQQQQSPASENGKPKPPVTSPKVPEEARLAALVALWGAAIALRGVFVPIAISVGAARWLRWLDEGGALAPRGWRRRWSFAGSRGQQRPSAEGQRGWWRRNAVLSYVPVLARMPREDLGGVGEAGLVTGETLADAWDKMYPPGR